MPRPCLASPPPSGHFNARFPRWNFEFNVGVGVRVACPQLGSQLRTWWWIVTANTTPRCMGLHARLMNSRDESRLRRDHTRDLPCPRNPRAISTN